MQVTSLTNSHNKAENYLLSICLWQQMKESLCQAGHKFNSLHICQVSDHKLNSLHICQVSDYKLNSLHICQVSDHKLNSLHNGQASQTISLTPSTIVRTQA